MEKHTSHSLSPEQASKQGTDLSARLAKHETDGHLQSEVNQTLKGLHNQSASSRDAFWKSFTANPNVDLSPLHLQLSREPDGMHVRQGNKEIYNQAKEERGAKQESTIRSGESAYAALRRQGYDHAEARQRAVNIRDAQQHGEFTQGEQYTANAVTGSIDKYNRADPRNKESSQVDHYNARGKYTGATRISEQGGTKTTSELRADGSTASKTVESPDHKRVSEEYFKDGGVSYREQSVNGKLQSKETFRVGGNADMHERTTYAGHTITRETFSGNGYDNPTQRRTYDQSSGNVTDESFKGGKLTEKKSVDAKPGVETTQSYENGDMVRRHVNDPKHLKETSESWKQGQLESRTTASRKDAHSRLETQTDSFRPGYDGSEAQRKTHLAKTVIDTEATRGSKAWHEEITYNERGEIASRKLPSDFK
jgi:hypothetical protein